MTQLGERLRLARESQGISLSQAAAETRILQRYLVALEDGDYGNLPGDVYTRGFIRNYASFLGFSADELIELYRVERGRTEPIQVVPATSSPRIRGFFAPSIVGVFFVVLALVGVSYLVLSATNRIGESAELAGAQIESPTSAPEPSPLPTNPPAQENAPAPTPLPTSQAIAAAPTSPLDTAGAAPSVTPALTAQPATPADPTAPIMLEVRIDSGDHRGSWLEIKTDGVSVYRKVLGPSGSVQYTAQRDVSVKAGNAAVVTVLVNGQAQRMGDVPGEVVTFTWPP
jgi:cytoskeletal protein RodZ